MQPTSQSAVARRALQYRVHSRTSAWPTAARSAAAAARGRDDGGGDGSTALARQPPDVGLQLPGGRSLTAFMGLWDQLTARLLPRDATGASADTLLAALQLLLSASAAQLSAAEQAQQRRQQQLQQQQWQQRQQLWPGQQMADSAGDAARAAADLDAALQIAEAAGGDAPAARPDPQQQAAGAPVLHGQLLAVCTGFLPDLRAS